MRTELRAAVAHALGVPVTGFAPITGGDINQAVRVVAGGERFFLKMHPNPPEGGFYAAEAAGLTRLADAAGGALRVPRPIVWDDAARPAWLLLEWLPRGSETAGAAERLGRGLALVHRTHNPAGRYGLDHDNFCGLTAQRNGWADDWPTFFGRQRLGALMVLARSHGHLPPERERRLERLIARLPEWLPATPPASLLHGDLWRGNWLPLADGGAALLDPAISFGDREADLAFTHLFGGFPARFHAAYAEANPLPPGHAERRDLLNLYHLLNHLTLFGESYGPEVDAVLVRYVG